MNIRLLSDKGYPKWWLLHSLAFIAAFLLVIFGEELSIPEIIKHPAFKLAMAGSYAIAILLIGYTHFLSLFLDRLWLLHAHQDLLKFGRIVFQIGWVYLPAIYLAAKLAAFYFSYGYNVDINDTSYPIYERQYIAVMLLCLNGLYLVLSFWKDYRRPRYAEVLETRMYTHQLKLEAFQPLLPEKPKSRQLGLNLIRFLPGRKPWTMDERFIGVKLSDIAYFELVEGQYFLKTFALESLVFDRSLDSLMQKLPHDHFFRLSRAIIVNKRALINKSELGGSRWRVFLDPSAADEINLSRKKTRELKRWLNRVGHEVQNTA
ncbi:hypothetical protein GCM10023231_18500 [Olivibacter ginsenosidimutans]|uniref:HTH LytTR-type domain-containing protein n=1 Tax=Olivibacter ginsenosidimutans TaxID=1176537 RepID=A0ABP9B5C7_9SPHI